MKKVFKHSLMLLLVLACSTLAKAQLSVSGKVTDEKNEGLIGVSVVVKGTTIGAITDLDGNYAIEVKGGNQVTLIYATERKKK